MTYQQAVVNSFFTNRLERHPHAPAVYDFDRPMPWPITWSMSAG